jgi:hypothetical protein
MRRRERESDVSAPLGDETKREREREREREMSLRR